MTPCHRRAKNWSPVCFVGAVVGSLARSINCRVYRIVTTALTPAAIMELDRYASIAPATPGAIPRATRRCFVTRLLCDVDVDVSSVTVVRRPIRVVRSFAWLLPDSSLCVWLAPLSSRLVVVNQVDTCSEKPRDCAELESWFCVRTLSFTRRNSLWNGAQSSKSNTRTRSWRWLVHQVFDADFPRPPGKRSCVVREPKKILSQAGGFQTEYIPHSLDEG